MKITDSDSDSDSGQYSAERDVVPQSATDAFIAVAEDCYHRCSQLEMLVGKAAVKQLCSESAAVVCAGSDSFPFNHCAAYQLEGHDVAAGLLEGNSPAMPPRSVPSAAALLQIRARR